MIEALKIGPEIRELTPEEILTLATDFAPHPLPDPRTSTAVGIIENGKIVGYQFLKVMLHVQPTKLNDGYAHMFTALCRATEETVLRKCGPIWAYVFCNPGHMEALAESRGMAKEPWLIMSKFVTHAVQKAPVMELMPVPAPPVEEPASEVPVGDDSVSDASVSDAAREMMEAYLAQESAGEEVIQ